ncbi:zinc finger and SCAN domain-containing protein 22-like isoform X1 [Phyllopteryx taeniolatus]|uniref:zinc finger and SCAN domain-containing protein 22-like isoform X1 n=2 Tax=Phycodurus eques TaxID=693459 RepID=UPI002ACD9586|nr:zinc finger and SCAN domain-containing protein 22-like isoform X1 [Phycodurus eques]XP_061641756.1 zinc finger and SCAN domain-containing protein 22-like isoform X1 [Phyllopteryx taeniolatus]
MTKLQFLNVFLTERLMLAAQEIYKSVEDTILEYQEEIAIRERENDHLRRRLRDAGIEIWPDRPSMALLEEEDGEHPRREWSPSMGHEERIPIQIKDKRDLRANQGELQGHGSCSTSENMFSPPRVANEYVQDGPHTSALPQSQGLENRERDAGSRGSSRHVKAESGGGHRGPVSSNNGGQPLAPVNPNCANENNIDIIGVENGGQMVGTKGNGPVVNRGQASHMRNQVANPVEYPHQKSPLQGHMSSFCCKVCGEAFSHVGHLHVHVQVHTREKPYRCGVCGKCCSSSGRLQEHQRSHTGEKPFRCQICGKGFTQMAHLKVHMRIHTGEKPYSCPVCGKCFSRSDKIKRHLQTHTREGTYFTGQ